MRIKPIPAVLALVAGSLTGYVGISLANASSTTHSSVVSVARLPQVESLIRDGLLAQMKVGSDPDLLDSTVHPAPGSEVLRQKMGSATPGRSAESKARVQQKWINKLADLTTAGPLRDRLSKQAQSFNDNVDDSFIDLGGGISAFSVSSSKETAERLDVDGTATLWNASSQIQNGNVVVDSPSSDIIFHVTLVPAPSSKVGWVISDLTSSFANGSAP